MKKLIIALLFVAVVLFAFSILDNTKVTLIMKPQSISAIATGTTVDLRGYQRMHVIVAGSQLANQTLKVNIYKGSGIATSLVDEATLTTTEGVLEFEVIHDYSYPYIVVETIPSSVTTLSVVGVIYGKNERPF